MRSVDAVRSPIINARAEVEGLAGPSASVTWLDFSPSALPQLSNLTVQAFIERSGLPVHPKQAWTDVATLQAWGVPAVNYGPGEPSQAHQPGEWVEISMLEQCERVLTAELTAP